MLQEYRENQGYIALNNLAFICLKDELNAAREKFSTNKFLMAALVEEVGELSQALIDHEFGEKSKGEVFEEAIQVAATALRVAQEGSAEFKYQPDDSCYLSLRKTN